MATILLVLFFTIFTTGRQPVMATILLVLFFTIFFHRETASDGYNLTGAIFHHFFLPQGNSQ